MAKADPERGGHRPKKGLLRGGKNRKEEGYTVPSGGKEAAGRRGRPEGEDGGAEEGRKRHTAASRHL